MTSVIGPVELQRLKWPLRVSDARPPAVPFHEDTLRACRDSHVLIYTPSSYADGSPITINSLREHFGVNPDRSEPCMYNQDWYLREEFAATRALDGGWHLVRTGVLEAARARQPEDIQAALSPREAFPSAVACTFLFFAYWYSTGGQKLWNHDFVWCRDCDHNGDRIYVGRYEDPAGTNKNGFNVHRHLSLRASFSAAPEVAPLA